MFCKACGEKMNARPGVCAHCGVASEDRGSAIATAIKEKPVAFILSFAWVILIGMGSIKTGLFRNSFGFANFIFIGVMPILGYWIYHLFINKKS